MSESTNGLEAFQRALREYTRYNRQDLGPLIENRGKRVQWELYRQFKAIAPTAERIEAEAVARGYAIRRRQGEDGRTLSVKEEIAARKKSRGWLSVSFLLRLWKARRDGQTGTFAALSRRRAEIGYAIVRTARGERRPHVRILSLLEGAMKQNEQRSLVDRALGLQAADMRAYIARKQQEELRLRLSRRFDTALGA